MNYKHLSTYIKQYYLINIQKHKGLNTKTKHIFIQREYTNNIFNIKCNEQNVKLKLETNTYYQNQWQFDRKIFTFPRSFTGTIIYHDSSSLTQKNISNILIIVEECENRLNSHIFTSRAIEKETHLKVFNYSTPTIYQIFG